MADVTKRVLITDLDDTLWNWLDIWYSAFYPMFQEILRVTGETEATLISVIKSIHERRGTSEYTFLIQEIEQSFGRQSDFETIRHKYGAAFHAFRKGRKEAQKLLPGVSSTLSY